MSCGGGQISTSSASLTLTEDVPIYFQMDKSPEIESLKARLTVFNEQG